MLPKFPIFAFLSVRYGSMLMKPSLLLIAFIPVLLGGCSLYTTCDDPYLARPVIARSSLVNSRWRAQATREDNSIQPVTDNRALTLQLSDEKLVITSSCEVLTGTWSLATGRLIVTAIPPAIRQKCSPAARQLDDFIFKLILSRPALELGGSEYLTLRANESNAVTLRRW